MTAPSLVVDVDGTLVDARETRRLALTGALPVSASEHALGQPPIVPVVEFVQAHIRLGTPVHIVTARWEHERHLTRQLLVQLGLRGVTAVHHRPPGRHRIDSAFKRAWVQGHLPASHHASLAIDDNPYIADTYDQLGLPVIQVPGWDVLSNASPWDLSLPEVRPLEKRSPV